MKKAGKGFDAIFEVDLKQGKGLQKLLAKVTNEVCEIKIKKFRLSIIEQCDKPEGTCCLVF